MTSLDTKFRNSAVRLLNKRGKTVTFSSISAGFYDPSTSSTINTTTTYEVRALIVDYSPKEFKEGLIIAGDKKFYLAAKGIAEPKPGDTITLNGQIWKVIYSRGFWSGKQIALYEVQARA